MQRRIERPYEEIRNCILENIPSGIGITRIEYEGPRIAIYTKKPEVLLGQSYVVADIAGMIKKRIVIRADPSVRLPEEEAERKIKEIIPKEAEISAIFFDPATGEVTIEVKKPSLALGKEGANVQEIIKATRWSPKIVKASPIPSKTITQIRHYMCSMSRERERIMREVGEAVFRTPVVETKDVRVTFLGGSMEVGRSAVLVQTDESSVLLDCGVNPASANPRDGFPRLNVPEFDLDRLDAVVITHAHLDHSGFLPFLYKYGYDGPVYCSMPTLSLMTLLQLDYLQVLESEGRVTPYSKADIRDAVLHAITLRFNEVTDIAPDIRLTLHNAGHILGSSIVHLHIGRGLHNIVYTGDFKFGYTRLLRPAASTFPRVETLIMESTYGAPEDVMPPRRSVEEEFVRVVNQTLRDGGKVLIPVPAVGRAQEIMVVLDEYMRRGEIAEVPVYVEGMIEEANGIHMAYPTYLSQDLKNKILYEDQNPFESEYFVFVKQPDQRFEIVEGGPCIILATSGMMVGGPVLEYFRQLAPDKRNTLLFVTYQVNGSLGRRIQSGLRQVSMVNSEGRVEVVDVNLRVETVEGFTGHSDRAQLISYVRKVSPTPRRVVLCHGEPRKCLNMAMTISRMMKLTCRAPSNLESIRLV